ncbi:MAG: aspartyl-tRNA(Asn)/glutamyl-tRNA(Gln) amidotransferase subunit [Acidimicrobiaceae bacterium]|nr:aspartyl-tRNA(Asn)/glutamyl-tRNA(Gln) amidotransferase subunit [Acidimicrobiaceae bacterium]
MESAIEVAESVRNGERKAVEVLDECLARIDAANPELNAFVHVDADLARREAERVDQAVANGDDPGPLAGVPFGVKDLEDCAGMPTSHGSLLYKGRPPMDEDSIHVGRLRAGGAVPVGKTAAPEFGAVCYTSTPAWGTTRNPWNPDRTPGGSSGGSAAAVAAGMVPFCTASDGGGSTRIPAAFSGLLGFKASYGRIPHPKAALSQTSVFGALTTTVADAARHLDVAAGPDDRDRASLPAPTVRYEDAIEQVDVAGLRTAWSPDLGFAVVEPEVGARAEEAAMALVEAANLKLVAREMAFTDPIRVWLTAGAVDLWQDLEKGMWPERRDDFDSFVRYGLATSESITVGRFARFLKWRERLEFEVAELFRDIDVLLTPATAVPAFDAAGPLPTEIAGQNVFPGMVVPFTMMGNLCWNPAVSVPAGLTDDGLPVGLQVMTRRHADEVVLRLARIFEQARPWPRTAPAYA